MNVGDYVIASRNLQEYYSGPNQLPEGVIALVTHPAAIDGWYFVTWCEGYSDNYNIRDVITLNPYFRDVFSPTEQELGMFEMLFGEIIKNNLLKALENKS